MIEFYEDLANAIVLQAVKDYRNARQALKKCPNSIRPMNLLMDCERFFLSDWFTSLTTLDGKSLLKQLQEEAI